MRKHRSTIIFLIVFLTGLSLLLYPSVANYVNEKHATRAIADYREAVSAMPEEDYAAYCQAAEEYNAKLADSPEDFTLTDGEMQEYASLLNPTGTGIMGYVDIPSIGVSLPIYHGTDDAVLRIGAGHIPGSSLPVGGGSTHCVLSGHRGLPSAKLFTNLDQLQTGDIFLLHVLDQTLEYEVDQIQIVEPEDVSSLGIAQGEDYCTLVTCTPYGINTQRLLVRGHRVPYSEAASSQVPADTAAVDPLLLTAVIAAPAALILFTVLRRRAARPKEKQRGVRLK